MTQEINIESVLEQLRLEYLVNSLDKLDTLDDIISLLLEQEGAKWRESYIEFQRQIHSIKGAAGSYGFQVVTEIAHSLEDYLETTNNLGVEQLNDIQRYIDQMRWIFEAGKNPSLDVSAEILRKLPSPIKSAFSLQEMRYIPVILLMPYNLQRKIVAAELASCGFRVFIADDCIRALELALTQKPLIVFSNCDIKDINGVEFAQVLNSIEATKSINIAILSSQEQTNRIFKGLPEDVKIIRKGEEFSDDLAKCLLDWHVFIRDARRSKATQERSHVRVSFDGLVSVAKGDTSFTGKLIDISAGGLSLKFNDFDPEEAHPFERGDWVTLNVEDLSAMSGSIIRRKNDSVFIRLDLDQHLQDRLLAEIMVITNHLDKSETIDWNDA